MPIRGTRRVHGKTTQVTILCFVTCDMSTFRGVLIGKRPSDQSHDSTAGRLILVDGSNGTARILMFTSANSGQLERQARAIGVGAVVPKTTQIDLRLKEVKRALHGIKPTLTNYVLGYDADAGSYGLAAEPAANAALHSVTDELISTDARFARRKDVSEFVGSRARSTHTPLIRGQELHWR
jgi:hypothetical protein